MFGLTCFAGLNGPADVLPVRARRARKTTSRLARAVAAAIAPRLEPLEQRQLLSVAINGSFTLDESAGLQTGGVAVSGEDNNDNDVAVGQLPLTLSNRLFGAPAGGLGLSNAFPTAIGVGKSADGFITVNETGTIVSLGFTKANGTPLPVLGGADPGVVSGLSAATGGAITLFADPVLGNRMVIGVDTAGDKVLALFLDPNATLTSAKVWNVEFEPLLNPDTTNFDDAMSLAGLGVAAGISTDFDFSDLPSGQNLFGVIGDPGTGLVIIGKNPILNADGTYTNASNTINTSQGGGGTTIGVNNQMFDAGEGAFFTFVKNPNPDFLGTSLSSTEADDADNIQYKTPDGTLEVDNGFLQVVQRQGSGQLRMRLSAFNLAGSPQGQAFVSAMTAGKPAVNITEVKVNGAVVFSGNQASVEVNIDAGATVSWKTAGAHDVVLVEGVSGKFDIGGFGTTQATTAVTPLSGVRYEDDGPAVSGQAQLVTLTVDETTLGTDASANASNFVTFDSVFGQDGSGTTTVSFALSLANPAPASGLVDTATGQTVVLSLVSGQLQGRTAVSNALVFTVSVNASGVITLDQIRAIVHPDTTSNNESKSLTLSNLLVATATTTDKDGDTVQSTVGDDVTLTFKDDGPSIVASPVNAPTLTADDTTLLTDDTKNFAGQFTPTFGADGQGATPRSYALSTPGGASGLVDTASGQNVVLSLSAGGVIEGRTATSSLLVFTVSVDQSGNVTLDQKRAVKHANANDPNESTGLTGTNLVVLTGNAFDGDGDKASDNLDLTAQLVFVDDGPGIGPISSSIVDFIAGSSATKSLNGVVGNDPNGAPYTIDSFTTDLTVNGLPLKGVASGNNTVVTYYADTSGNGVFGDAGDSAFYKLELNQTANSGAGSYTFTVLASPPPAETSFDFDDLPSGQNLFGVIGDATTGLVIIGRNPILNADGTFTNASNTINTSKGGGATTIGVNNQMFDAGEGAFFTFVKDPNPNFLGTDLSSTEADDADNIQYSSPLEVDNGFLQVVQRQGNGQLRMRLSAFNMAGAAQGQAFVTAVTGAKPAVNITEIKINGVVVFTGSQASVEININAGDLVSWKTSGLHDCVLVEGVAGKFDIGGFGTTQGQPTPDQKLDFVVKVTDGDGDSATSGFSIGIDGTGPFDDDIVAGVTVSSLSSLFSSDSVDDSLAALLA